MLSIFTQKVAGAIAAADELKKQETTKKIQLKEERAKSARERATSARMSLRQTHLDREEIRRKRLELSSHSKQLNLGGFGSKVRIQILYQIWKKVGHLVFRSDFDILHVVGFGQHRL